MQSTGITVVTGPPCAGKSTHVQDRRGPGDVVVDLDLLAKVLGHPGGQITWTEEHAARVAGRIARVHLIDAALDGQLDAHVWIVETSPTPLMRRRYDDAGADVIVLDPGLDVCLDRAAARPDPDGTRDQIRDWYSRRDGARWVL